MKTKPKRIRVSIVLPLYNGESTVKSTLESLIPQMSSSSELVVVDNGSRDKSAEVVKKYLKNKKVIWRLDSSRKQLGLAGAYNRGISLAKGETVVTIHQDVVLKRDALRQLTQPLFDHQEIVASTHVVAHPFSDWRKFNFWQKCFFSRLAGKKYAGLDGKFDAFRKSSLLAVGGFDSKDFFSAGEDGDIVERLKILGRMQQTGAEILHSRQVDRNFGPVNIIKKQAQYAEAQGAMLRLHGPRSLKLFLMGFFRELLILGLGLPYVQVLSVVLIVAYSFLFTCRVYLYEYKNPRIFILPFFNILLLFVSFYYSLGGFIRGRETR